MENLTKEKSNLMKVGFVLAIIVSVFFAVKVYGEIKEASLLGESTVPATISFSGHGEVTAKPDIANVYFTISQEAKTVKEAQASVAVIEKKALDFLKSKNVAEKDIKTADASFYPKYDYVRALCPQIEVGSGVSGASYNCGNGKQVLTGYTASESITVKIRQTDDAGAIMQGLGATGVSDLSGPNFAIDNEDGLKAEARKKAIDNAKEKAKILAKDLGVKLVKITSFNESGNNYPMMYTESAMLKGGASSAPAPAEIPKGENTISSDVTITYEIR
ncbi:MAG: SIMPL domain-containing protein [Candidatus Berkelbacteria bacterium]|nr:SIMPL domain-containing protein [Candidatus Berkelbacteria bacterium]